MASRWCSPSTPTNKTDCHDTTEILLKVALNTITLTHNSPYINPNLIAFFLYFFHKVISFIGLYFCLHKMTLLHLCIAYIISFLILLFFSKKWNKTFLYHNTSILLHLIRFKLNIACDTCMCIALSNYFWKVNNKLYNCPNISAKSAMYIYTTLRLLTFRKHSLRLYNSTSVNAYICIDIPKMCLFCLISILWFTQDVRFIYK
jgi:hypothetical protein